MRASLFGFLGVLSLVASACSVTVLGNGNTGGTSGATGGTNSGNTGGNESVASSSSSGGASVTGGASGNTGGAMAIGGTVSVVGGASNGSGGQLASGGSASAASGNVFARMLPRDTQIYGQGPLIAAKPNGDVIVMGPSAPADLFPSAVGVPFLVEFDDSGNVVKSKAFPNGVLADALTVDSSGSTLLLTQLYLTQTSFGGTPMAPVANGFALVKLDDNFQSVFELPITTDTTVFIQSVTTDSNNDIYVGLEANITTPTWVDEPQLQKYSKSGVRVWSQTFSHDNSGAYPNDLAIAGSGDLIACGSFNGNLTIGSTVLQTQAKLGNDRMYNGWYGWFSSTAGAPVRAARFGGPTFDLCNAVNVTSTGAVHITGSMSDKATFAGSTVTYSTDGDAFVAEMNPDGSLAWLTNLNLPTVAPFDAAVGKKNETYVAGRLTRTLSGASQQFSFLASVSASGQLGPRKEYPSTQGNGADHVVVSSTGAVWITGTTDGIVDFGSGPVDFGKGQLYVVRLPGFF